MKVSQFSLGIFIFLALLVIVPSFASANPINLEREQFLVGEIVRLHITLAPERYSEFSLQISSSKKSFTYKGEFNDIMLFYPMEEDIYTAALVEKSTGANFYNASILVLPEKNNRSSPGIEDEPIISGSKRGFKLKDSKGSISALETEVLQNALDFRMFVEGEKYDVAFRLGQSKKKIVFTNLKYSQNASLKYEELKNIHFDISKRNPVKSFSIDPSLLEFDEANISAKASGTELWKCKDWIFDLQQCNGTWLKIMDLVQGGEYSFVINSADPGFTETTPTNGTADMGDLLNLSGINYIDGVFNDTSTNNDIFWAAGTSNDNAASDSPAGFMNLTYNLSSILLNNTGQLTLLNFSISYCHTRDDAPPTTCQGLLSNVAYNQNIVELYNYSGNSWFALGGLQLSDGIESEANYLVSNGFSDFISSNWMASIRYPVNFTISQNGRDALLAIDYAPLMVESDSNAPSIIYAPPTESSGEILQQDYLIVNVTANDSNLKNISISIFNSSGHLINKSIAEVSHPVASFGVNLSGILYGRYYFNATACDNATNCNLTETRNITLAAPMMITAIIADDSTPGPINQIDLIAGSTRQVYCNVSVYNGFGYGAIAGLNSSFYFAQTDLSAPDDNRTHYSNNSCNRTFESGNVSEYSCAYDIYYYATNGTWICTSIIWDNVLISNNSDTSNISQLFALNISSPFIDYSNLAQGQTSDDISVNITNFGNVPINISVYGFGGDNSTEGENLSMICSTNNIGVEFQKYSIMVVPYQSKKNLTSIPADMGLTIFPQQNSSEEKFNSSFWQLNVPGSSNALGQCNGTLIFSASAT